MLLGDVHFKRSSFPNLDEVFREFDTKDFQQLIDRGRSEWVNRVLLDLIQKEKEPCFLLPAVLEYIERVEKEQLLQHYTFTSFELWLNQNSHLSFEENFRVRGKIAGKGIERSDYQGLFPIGMGKVYEGTHFVTAHRSPDLDTTIASFWGWLDAFAARVGNGLHIWNLPGGPPGSQIEIDLIFRDLFNPSVFTHLPKTRTALTLTGNDLLSQKNFHRKTLHDPLASIDHDRDHNAVVIVDGEGFYLGDWRTSDVEGVREVIILLSSALRWFENNLNLRLISLFSKEKVTKSDIAPLLRQLFDLKIGDCEPAVEFSARQKKEVQDFLVQVLQIAPGLGSTFEEVGIGMHKLGMARFAGVDELVDSMETAKLFDAKGHLVEDRPRLFHLLEKIVRELHESILKIRGRMEQFDIALAIKNRVFGRHPNFITVRADLEEIRNKMDSYQYLTVVYPDQGRFYPVGIVQAADVRKNTLGTVSLRDFCNRDEMTIPSYLEVISVIDHHKTALNTFSAPLAIIGDAQSSNTLVAECAFQINDRYSLGGMTPAQIEEQFAAIAQKEKSPGSMRTMHRLLQRRMAVEYKESSFIHPQREFTEYLHFLYAILDDTDLLSKVTVQDLEVVASLLNRMKSIAMKKEVEIAHFDDLPRDKNFVRAAARRLLQNEEMYSLYRKVYQYREKEVERNIDFCADRKPSNFFADTKEQNGCCRIGQTKLFANNISHFEKKAQQIRHFWLETAQKIHKEKPEIDLHLHMISTIVSGEEVFKGGQAKHTHRDELWIWASPDETGVEHLKSFLGAFQQSPGLHAGGLEVEFLGTNAAELSQIFKESFLDIPQKTGKRDAAMPIAILRFAPGALNSRKAMVSPYLPSV